MSNLDSRPTDWAQRLLGVWRLVRWEIAYSDARPSTYPFGLDATGLIQYTHDGGMAACIAHAARPVLSSASVRSAPVAEQVQAFESYFQYAGRFTTRMYQDQPQVVHQVSHSLNPNFVGTEQVRNVHFSPEDGLTLSAADPLPGSDVLRHHRLVWSR